MVPLLRENNPLLPDLEDADLWKSELLLDLCSDCKHGVFQIPNNIVVLYIIAFFNICGKL